MIKILERYIARNTIMATGMAALLIGGVLFLLTLLGELKNIGEGDYDLVQAVFYVLFRLPNDLYQFSPMILLLGSIIGLSILSSTRELSVMRVYGFSIRKIVYSVLMAAMLLIVFISIAGESVAPNLSYKAAVRKENAKNAGQAVLTAAGVWFHIENNFIHVQHVVGRQLLEGVTRYQFDDQHRLTAAYYAKSLMQENQRWYAKDMVKTTFYHDQTKSESFAQTDWDVKLNANLLNLGLIDPNEMSLFKLGKFSRYLKQNGLQASEYEYSFWQRVFQPLASLIMILLAIPFVLGTQATATLGWRVIIGIMAGLAFFILNAFLGQLCIVYQIPAIFAALFPLLIFLLFVLFLFNRLIKT